MRREPNPAGRRRRRDRDPHLPGKRLGRRARASPSADAGGPYTVVEGSSVLLDATGAGGEAPLSYRWTGAADELSNSEIADPRFTGRDDATLTLNLAVTDAAGLTGRDDTTVTVTNA